MKFSSIYLAALAALGTPIGPANAEPVGAQIESVEAIRATLHAKGPSQISRQLLGLAQQWKDSEAARLTGRPMLRDAVLPGLSIGTNVRVVDGKVWIEGLPKGDHETLAAEFRRVGATDVRTTETMVGGWLALSAVDRLSEITSASLIRAAQRGINSIGTVTSQGDAGQRSDIARAQLGVNGAGSTVGILSDSWNLLGTAAQGITSGNLPGPGNPDGFTTPALVLKDTGGFGSTDEGRAMGEIVHDVAPGAKLAFYGPLSYLDHAAGVRALANSGATVIVDDFSWFTSEPFYQPSPIDTAAKDVASQKKITVISSASNLGNKSLEGVFNPSPSRTFLFNGSSIGTGKLHDFGGGRLTIPITLKFGSVILFGLQWDEPFASSSPPGVGAGSDLDLLVFSDAAGVNVLGGGAEANVGGDAVEQVLLSNQNPAGGGASIVVYLGIARFDDTTGTPKAFKIVAADAGNPVITDSSTFNKSTIVGHPAGANAITSCAVAYNLITTPNGPVPESFSSVGGFKFTRDANGTPLSQPLDTKKPDFCSPDGADTSFFPAGAGQDTDGDGFPNFFGTSASAPHLAGVVALMQQRFGRIAGLMPPTVVRTTLLGAAKDMDDPFGTPGYFDYGYDTKTGFGFIDALKAVTNTPALPGALPVVLPKVQ